MNHNKNFKSLADEQAFNMSVALHVVREQINEQRTLSGKWLLDKREEFNNLKHKKELLDYRIRELQNQSLEIYKQMAEYHLMKDEAGNYINLFNQDEREG